MLELIVSEPEMFDEKKQEFLIVKQYKLQLEHSLVSLSKWESKWKKPFLDSKDKTTEETIDYVRCMTITQNVDPVVYSYIRQSQIDIIAEYIDAPMTATTFSMPKENKTNKEKVTAELIYYWMIAFTIPFECQRWHLNRLLTLINVCNIKNQPKNKMSRKEAAKQQRSLNAQRRAALNTKG